MLDIRKAESQSHVLPAAAVISTLNFAFEISTDGVPRAYLKKQQRAVYRMRAAKAPRRLEHIPVQQIVSSHYSSLQHYNTTVLYTLQRSANFLLSIMV